MITLGDGEIQNAVESSVAAANEYGKSIDFEVYALTHADLAVDYQFKFDGNTNDATVDVTVDTADTANARMALSYNGCGGTGTAFPRSLFSAPLPGRFHSEAGTSAHRAAFPRLGPGNRLFGHRNQFHHGANLRGHPPPNFVSSGDGYTLPPGGTLTLEFEVTVG